MGVLLDTTELSSKDIASLRGIKLRSAENVRTLIRRRLGKAPYSSITYAEYKKVFDIKL